eukprot:10483391-Heterocapsa_arctica.AAC.1
MESAARAPAPSMPTRCSSGGYTHTDETLFYHSIPEKLSMTNLAGEHWPEVRPMQLLLQSENVDLHIKDHPQQDASAPASAASPAAPPPPPPPARHEG